MGEDTSSAAEAAPCCHGRGLGKMAANMATEMAMIFSQNAVGHLWKGELGSTLLPPGATLAWANRQRPTLGLVRAGGSVFTLVVSRRAGRRAGGLVGAWWPHCWGFSPGLGEDRPLARGHKEAGRAGCLSGSVSGGRSGGVGLGHCHRCRGMMRKTSS